MERPTAVLLITAWLVSLVVAFLIGYQMALPPR